MKRTVITFVFDDERREVDFPHNLAQIPGILGVLAESVFQIQINGLLFFFNGSTIDPSKTLSELNIRPGSTISLRRGGNPEKSSRPSVKMEIQPITNDRKLKSSLDNAKRALATPYVKIKIGDGRMARTILVTVDSGYQGEVTISEDLFVNQGFTKSDLCTGHETTLVGVGGIKKARHMHSSIMIMLPDGRLLKINDCMINIVPSDHMPFMALIGMDLLTNFDATISLFRWQLKLRTDQGVFKIPFLSIRETYEMMLRMNWVAMERVLEVNQIEQVRKFLGEFLPNVGAHPESKIVQFNNPIMRLYDQFQQVRSLLNLIGFVSYQSTNDLLLRLVINEMQIGLIYDAPIDRTQDVQEFLLQSLCDKDN